MIKRSTIDFILDNVPIDEVVKEYVTLHKRGNNLFGLCPFHNEKTPSFSVAPDKGIFKCFGCGESGNVITFLMKIEQLSYPEAIRTIAKKYQIPVDEDGSELDEEKDEKEKIFILNQIALEWFKAQLWSSEEGVDIALSYLHHRGISDYTIQKFNLGYGLNQRDAFRNHALKKGFTDEDLINAGLIIPDSLADRFRGRLIFPIFNVGGRVIAFGGRAIGNNKNIAKYVNSPETLIYTKSNIVYNLNNAKKNISQQDLCYITEGYMDVISLVQAGIDNVVASAGTSLTQVQIKTIHRFTNNVCLMYDADSAGIKASFRAIDMLLEEGLNVYLISFPEGEDPDSFTHKVSTTELIDYLKTNKENFINFKSHHLIGDKTNDPIKKADAIRNILFSLSHISDPLIQAEYLVYISKNFDIDEFTLREEFQRILRDRLKKQLQNTYNYNPITDKPKKKLKNQKNLSSINNKINQQEKRILYILIHFGNRILTFIEKDEFNFDTQIDIPTWKYINQELKLDKIEFAFYKDLYELIIDQYQTFNNFNINNIISDLNPEEQDLMYDLLLDTFKLSENWEKKLKIEVNTIENNDLLYYYEVECSILEYKALILDKLKNETREKIKKTNNQEEQEKLLEEFAILKHLENQILKKISSRNLIR
ncbi:MAG TPA: DNA primase [Bacteroidales bacterium]|jgi:DNA primase|nr:DNA primase [Bacteroidales bacterium]MDI9575404.1 DNA primase [Bacteroidota bacterium]HOB77605.1 DNA primase [Bacteroidales bacterium]HPZ61501.1 DNA primase [Bacteroidales bacterium]HQD59143.1 DNA primase [Bacteroidales bacterium]